MITLDYAISAVSQCKPGTCTILPQESGQLMFVGFGVRGRVIWLESSVDGTQFTQDNFPFALFLRRGKDDRSAWAVLADEKLNFLFASDDTAHSFVCQALINPQVINGETSKPPLCLIARFDQSCSALTVIHEDSELPKLILANHQAVHSAISAPLTKLKGDTNDDDGRSQVQVAQQFYW